MYLTLKIRGKLEINWSLRIIYGSKNLLKVIMNGNYFINKIGFSSYKYIVLKGDIKNIISILILGINGGRNQSSLCYPFLKNISNIKEYYWKRCDFLIGCSEQILLILLIALKFFRCYAFVDWIFIKTSLRNKKFSQFVWFLEIEFTFSVVNGIWDKS